jgi:hypothetical protein
MIAEIGLISGCTGALAAIVDPSTMRRLCAWGLAHAEALDNYRESRKNSAAHWKRELRVGE